MTRTMRLRGSSFCTPRAKKKKKKKKSVLHVIVVSLTGKDLRVVVSCVVVMKRGISLQRAKKKLFLSSSSLKIYKMGKTSTGVII